MRQMIVVLLKLVIVMGAIFIGIIFYTTRPGDLDGIPVQPPEHPYIISDYANQEFGLRFKFLNGLSRYELKESPTVDLVSGLVYTITIARYEDIHRSLPIDGEGPPTISIKIFNNLQKQSLLSWAERNIQYSNLNLKIGEIRNITIDGRDAVSYMADGLYASENIIVINGDYVYLISGMFIDTESQLRKDFSPFVESIRFVPPQVGGGQGKLDINTVCEGALAYMTFPDGKSADAFVAECKEGKHPEVIEQYKAQMGLGDGVVL